MRRKQQPKGNEATQSWRGRHGADPPGPCKSTKFRILIEDSIRRALESHGRIGVSSDISRFDFQKGSIKNRMEGTQKTIIG